MDQLIKVFILNKTLLRLERKKNAPFSVQQRIFHLKAYLTKDYSSSKCENFSGSEFKGPENTFSHRLLTINDVVLHEHTIYLPKSKLFYLLYFRDSVLVFFSVLCSLF